MRQADVAVIVPVYNRAGIVLDALESIATQTLPPRSLIIIDDGSTDGTGSAVEKWLQKAALPFHARLVSQSNQGVAAARNTGLRESLDIKYVAFLDSDDLWPADFLQRTVPLLEENTEAVAAVCNVTYQHKRVLRKELIRQLRRVLIKAGLKKLLRPLLRKKLHRSHEYIPLNPVGWFLRHAVDVNCSSVLRREAVESIGGFDESLRINEDTIFYLALAMAGPWLFAPGDPVIIRSHVEEWSNGETNLTQKYVDITKRWVLAHESFLATHDVSKHIEPHILSRILARKWTMAGNRFRVFERRQEAAECYGRALRYNPRFLPAYWGRWLCSLRSD